MKTLMEIQKAVFEQYLRDKKDKIWKGKGNVGDIGELGLICEEIGEAMNGIRKRKGKENLAEECADIIVRTLNFMSRKGIDAQTAITIVHGKNWKRNRCGLFIDNLYEEEKAKKE